MTPSTPDPHKHLLDSVEEILAQDPGVGFSLVDADGVIRFANARAAHLFTHSEPDDIIGKSLSEIYGQAWADERLCIFDRIRETGVPVVLRHIRHGLQIQSTIRRLTDDTDDQDTFLVITVEGEHDPSNPDQFDIIESDLMHLGPLGSLTKREIEVLALVGHGLSTIEIGKALFRSPRTIERHCDSIRSKLDGASRVQMAEFARRAGLQTDDSQRRRV